MRLSGGKDPRLGGQRSRTEYFLSGQYPNLSEACFLHLGNGDNSNNANFKGLVVVSISGSVYRMYINPWHNANDTFAVLIISSANVNLVEVGDEN